MEIKLVKLLLIEMIILNLKDFMKKFNIKGNNMIESNLKKFLAIQFIQKILK